MAKDQKGSDLQPHRRGFEWKSADFQTAKYCVKLMNDLEAMGWECFPPQHTYWQTGNLGHDTYTLFYRRPRQEKKETKK